MEFKEKLQIVFKETPIEILKYSGEKLPIEFKCCSCGKIYKQVCARNLLSKITLCKKCYNPFSRWDKERIKIKLKRLYPNSNLELIEFNGIRKGGKIKCLKCGVIEEIKNFDGLFCGRKDFFCNNCEKEKNIIYKHLEEELKKGYLKLLEWKGVNEKSKFQCNRCGHIFKKQVHKNFNGEICPNCFKVYNKFNFEDAQNLLNKKGNNEYELLQYKGMNERSLVKHQCGFCFSIRLTDFEKTKGCPKCYKKFSKLEQKVAQWLDNNNYDYKRQIRFNDLPKYSFDFSVQINNKEILIEVQGQQHYRQVEIFDDFKIQEKRDNNKREYCLVNNIPLIEIPYWEIENLNNFLPLKFKDYLEREQA